MLAFIIAQSDAIGYSGWASAGLLTSVLGWLLLKHLPEKDKQIKDMVDQMKAIYEQTQSRLDLKSKDYSDRLQTRDEKFLVVMDKLSDRLNDMGRALLTICRYSRGTVDHQAVQTVRMGQSEDSRSSSG